MTRFAYDAALLARYPTIVGGVIHATRVSNGPSPEGLNEAFRAEQAAALTRLADRALSDLPSISAWRRAFRAFGVEPTQYRCAAEALLRRLTKQGSIPSINALVDLGNLVSIRYALPVAVFDRAAVTGGTLVRFAAGTERFTDLGTASVEQPEPGEVIFVDDAGLVSARRWCWRQSAESAASDASTDILVTVEGHHDGARADVEAATTTLVDLLTTWARPSETRTAILTAEAPVFED